MSFVEMLAALADDPRLIAKSPQLPLYIAVGFHGDVLRVWWRSKTNGRVVWYPTPTPVGLRLDYVTNSYWETFLPDL